MSARLVREPLTRRARALAALLLTATVAPAHAAESTAVVGARGWQFRVHAEGLPGVGNLAIAADGALYATLGLPGGKGRVVRVGNPGGIEDIATELNRPDGFAAHGRKLYVTEELAEGRVLEINLENREVRTLTTLNNPEGIALLPNGDIVLSEDSVNGRLVLWHRRNGQVETLIGGLSRPEGIALAPGGTIYVAETATGRVLSYRDGYLKSVVVDLDEPDQLRLGPDGALWITEDSRRGRLLRLKDGALTVVLSGLDSPQGMVFTASGVLLVAEQGRARILAVTREEERR
jgi:sugar lactone lactonase YvrE